MSLSVSCRTPHPHPGPPYPKAPAPTLILDPPYPEPHPTPTWALGLHAESAHTCCLLFSADSPVLWLRVDPEMSMLRHVTLEQPDIMWQFMLKYERDVVSQCEVSVQSFCPSV